MKSSLLVLASFALLGAADPGLSDLRELVPRPNLRAAEPLATGRHVHGVITTSTPSELTIASDKHAVTGRIDPARTRVTVNGKPGTLRDLRVAALAKGELCLDDVWLVVDAH
jgi:hypothetical protein